MKNKFLTLAFVFCAVSAALAVDVPEFSFTGEEIADFTIAPSFKDIDLSVSVPSEYNNYMDKQAIEVARDASSEYSADEPSFVYGYKPLTALASLFVGQKAYRNYFVKLFVNNEYKAVIENYAKYDKDITEAPYREEVDFIYASSVVNTGGAEGMNLLRDACVMGADFKDPACDRYMEILMSQKDYDEIIATGDELTKPYTIYTFSIYTMAHLKKGNYDKVSALLNENPDLVFQYADFNDMRALVEYYKGNYPAVVKLRNYTTPAILFVTVDSLINTGNFDEAAIAIPGIVDEQDKRYLTAKNYIGMKRYADASKALAGVESEASRLSLMKYYVATEFGNLNRSTMNSFKVSGDYVSYYMGLQAFQDHNYAEAASLLGNVNSPADIATDAKFYRGIALVYIDPDQAEQDIIVTMNTSTDPVQVGAARYMLAQVYYLKGMNNDALQLLDGCSEAYCNQLRAEINVQKGRFGDAMAGVSGMDTPQARLIRASAYYNMMEYDKAEAELNAMNSTSKDALHLRMKLLFKKGDVKGASKILTENKDYDPILYDGVRELMLAGDYKLASQLLNERENLPDDMLVAKAKILAWEGKNNEAAAIYRQLAASGDKSVLYDAYFGLISVEKPEMTAISRMLPDLQAGEDFPQKDLLLAQLASKVSQAQDNTMLVRVLNIFFPQYEDSPYAGDMYAERAKLFLNTGRAMECINDINAAVALNPALGEELRFMKALCTEDIDNKAALAEYRAMFAENELYGLPSAVKIMDLSTDPGEVLETAMELRAENPQLFVEGIRKYVEMAPVSELEANEPFIAQLENDNNKALVCSGLYARARLLNEAGKGIDAAKTYVSIYNTDPKDHFALPGLDAAIIIYVELKMDKDAEATKNIKNKI